jgi:hypothetical protein
MEAHPRAGEAARGEKVAQRYPSAEEFLCGSSRARIEDERALNPHERTAEESILRSPPRYLLRFDRQGGGR